MSDLMEQMALEREVESLRARLRAVEQELAVSRDLWPVLALNARPGREVAAMNAWVQHRGRVAALLKEAQP